jgi:hypothetical protein
MKNSKDVQDFLSEVDSIQRRFMESLITGQRDAMFRQSIAETRLHGQAGPDSDRTNSTKSNEISASPRSE